MRYFQGSAIPIAAVVVVLAAFSGTRAETLTAAGQGWVDDSGLANGNSPNNNTFTGWDSFEFDPGVYRSHFSFDLSSVSGTVTSATLVDSGAYYDSPNASETLGLFDVSTSYSTIGNGGTAEFADLGSGTSFGTFHVPAYSLDTTLSFVLNSDALAAINAAEGSYFSIGGALLNMNQIGSTTEDEGIFADSYGNPATLFLTVEPSAPLSMPLPSTACAGLGLLGGLGCWMLGRRRKVGRE